MDPVAAIEHLVRHGTEDDLSRFDPLDIQKAMMRPVVAAVATMAIYLAVHPRFPRGVRSKVIVAAARSGRLDVVRLLPHGKFHKKVVRAAVCSGNLELVKCLHDSAPAAFTIQTITVAVARQDVRMVEYLVGVVPDARTRHVDPSDPGNLDITVGMNLVQASTVQDMKRAAALAQDCTPPEGRIPPNLAPAELLYACITDDDIAWGLRASVAQNHLPVVEYLCDERPEQEIAQAMAAAVEKGNLEIVKFLHPRCPTGCSESAVREALDLKHWDVLKYLDCNEIY
ncbi:hypothetical protein RI367_005831 [Sorochytrium milnesiophthora]